MATIKSSSAAGLSNGLLKSPVRLNPFWVFAIVLAVDLIDELLVGYLTGHWTSSPTILGARDDYPHWLVAFIFQPGVWAFFAWLPGATHTLLDRIGAEAIPEPRQADYRLSQEHFLKVAGSAWLYIISALLGVVLLVLSLFYTSSYHPVPWTYALEWHRDTIWSLRLFLAGSIFSYCLIYSFMVIFFLNRVFGRYGVRLHLYHGDNVAGLKFIGDFDLKLNQLALILIVFLLSDLVLALQYGRGVGGQTNVIIEVIGFPIILLFGFVAPLVAVHRAMQEAKVAEINEKADQIIDTLQKLSAANPTKAQIEDLTALISLRDRLSADIPTLPIDVAVLRTFSLNFILSLLPAMVGAALQVIKLFKP